MSTYSNSNYLSSYKYSNFLSRYCGVQLTSTPITVKTTVEQLDYIHTGERFPPSVNYVLPALSSEYRANWTIFTLEKGVPPQ